MSPTPTTLNPSETVERIREIIVGRHLERLECRISRLETAPAARASESPTDVSVFEDRMLANEAHVEALQQHAQRMEGAREDIERTAAMYREEAHRLAEQIHEIAREKSAPSDNTAVEGLERKLGAWLTEWQKSVNARLDDRDRLLTERISAELAAHRREVESRIREARPKDSTDIDERFSRIAEAARALAESVGSFSTPAPSKP